MDRKWTYLMFVVGGLLLAYLLTRSGLWAWDYLATSDFAGDYVGKPKELLVDAFGVGLAGLGTLCLLYTSDAADE